MTGQLGIVAIGRNEGERLRLCLESLQGLEARVVYVDSGSTDGSVTLARQMGAEVVELDMNYPFTAARARNAGFAALEAEGLPEFIQFVDGDCALVPGWTDAAIVEMLNNRGLGVVTGWRAEIHADATAYNAMCHHEWRRPAGPITACGGDMMVRVDAFEQAGGFNPTVIAAEDDEFCLRIAQAGFKLIRLPFEMTRHDANIQRFAQWWQRSIRNGHGFAQLGNIHPHHLRRERQRVYFFAILLPLIFLVGLTTSFWISSLVIAAYIGSYMRGYQGLLSDGVSRQMAPKIAILLTLSKFPNLIGMIKYHLRKLRGTDMQIIEYK